MFYSCDCVLINVQDIKSVGNVLKAFIGSIFKLRYKLCYFCNLFSQIQRLIKYAGIICILCS
uniref:Uncharacterized protein n=1 Tax=Rhizophora mucronata TaxID=61149 RepID=A0A2P2QCJ8_RHIMU